MGSADFDAAGPADGPPIVLLHGSVVTRKMWLPQLRGLSDTYRVIAPDLPGHGAAAHVPFTFTAAVQSLDEIIQTHARGRALVAGLSLGGYVAMQLAYENPARVAGLVLSGCSLSFTRMLGGYLRLVGALMRRGWLKQSRAKAEQKTRQLFPAALSDVAEAQMEAGVYPDAVGPAFAEMAGRDFAALVAAYPGPCLILNGRKDSASRRGEAKFLGALQQGRAQVIEDAGHACNLDQAEAYNQAVRDFAESIGWRSLSRS